MPEHPAKSGAANPAQTGQEQRTLGTFLGVYTPTVLTILGVIMYLRSGWVLGNLGLTNTILLVILANSITLITTLSFSSMATNMKVGTGGAYFIISRSLGLGAGAAIGIPVFLSQAISITLYSYGLAESLSIVWPDIPLKTAAVVIILLITLLSLRGAKVALRAQIPLMVLVGLSLIALVVGALLADPVRDITGPEPRGVPFWVGFAVFFPAMTGVMAGLSLSGDLKSPAKAIPIGAVGAVLTGFAVYMLIPVFLNMGASTEQLKTDPLVWLQIAPYGPWLILPGLWGAVLSSAVGSMLGAPRTLQALIIDQSLRRHVRRFVGSANGLRLALAFSAGIALLLVLLGNLNAVAKVVTMFFLTVYGTINVAAGLESLSGDPSWRPRFQVPWAINIACGLACLAVMMLISPIAGLVAVVVEVGLWFIFVRREGRSTWGDSRRGLYEMILRWVLILLSRRPMSPRNWRPHVLVFVDDPHRRRDLIKFASWFSQNRGVVTVCEVLVGDLLERQAEVQENLEAIKNVAREEKLTVFPEVDVAHNIVDGIINISQANGIAGFASNTIVLGWPKDDGMMINFLNTARRLEALRKSIVIGRVNPGQPLSVGRSVRQIHVWWGGLKQNGDLMLLLAWLLTRNSQWRNAELRIISAASSEMARDNTKRYLDNLLNQTRIDARVDVFLKPTDRNIRSLIHEQSASADVVFLGLAVPPAGKEGEYVLRMRELAADMPVVFFVKNSSLFVGELLHEENLEPE
jgi:amino acid transporter